VLRRLQTLVVLGVSVVSAPAIAVEAEEVEPNASAEAPAAKQTPAADDASAGQEAAPVKEAPVADEAAAAKVPAGVDSHADVSAAHTDEENSSAPTDGWHLEAHGYFRAPLIMGLSSRPDPDDPNGRLNTQVSFGPNRIADWSYYSFGYTRLQEQDWAELAVHVKKKHVDAALGWMGYWFQGIGFRNPDASWAPGLAYLTLDTDLDIDIAGRKPNVAVTMGAFWPKYGYVEKYDTYTLGRFRQMGEETNIKIPLGSDLTTVLTQGFGAGRDGSYQGYTVGGADPIYGTIVALDLVTWLNLKLSYKKFADLGLHFNTEWTADPNLAQGTTPNSKSYGVAVKHAHLSVIGAELNVRAPYAGHLWLSPSFISVRNGWALNRSGTEVMHSLGGGGLSTSYLFWTNSPDDPTGSTGSGSLTNVGFLYENSLSSVRGKEFGTVVPDVTVSLFGLLVKSKADLPATSTLTQKTLNELKYGVDATLQATTWFGFMLRYDLVNMDMDHGGYVFSAVTPRMIFSSHFLSSERFYIQYSRYTYGDNVKLGSSWMWGSALAAGSTVFQAGPYQGRTPDRNVLKLQAEIAF
jgi:hypothetical protein